MGRQSEAAQCLSQEQDVSVATDILATLTILWYSNHDWLDFDLAVSSSFLLKSCSFNCFRTSDESTGLPPNSSLLCICLQPAQSLQQLQDWHFSRLTPQYDWDIYQQEDGHEKLFVLTFQSSYMADGIFAIDSTQNFNKSCVLHQSTNRSYQIHKCVEEAHQQDNWFQVAIWWWILDYLCSFPVQRLVECCHWFQVLLRCKTTKKLKSWKYACLVTWVQLCSKLLNPLTFSHWLL